MRQFGSNSEWKSHVLSVCFFGWVTYDRCVFFVGVLVWLQELWFVPDRPDTWCGPFVEGFGTFGKVRWKEKCFGFFLLGNVGTPPPCRNELGGFIVFHVRPYLGKNPIRPIFFRWIGSTTNQWQHAKVVAFHMIFFVASWLVGPHLVLLKVCKGRFYTYIHISDIYIYLFYIYVIYVCYIYKYMWYIMYVCICLWFDTYIFIDLQIDNHTKRQLGCFKSSFASTKQSLGFGAQKRSTGGRAGLNSSKETGLGTWKASKSQG